MSDTYLSDTHLTGKTPGQITSTGKVPGLDKKGTVWIDKGQQADGRWLYWRKGYTPPVETPAPPPTPASSDRFLSNDRLLIGIAPTGTLGSRADSPAELRQDSFSYKRRGLYDRQTNSDYLIVGAGGDGFMIGYRDADGAHSIVQGASINSVGIPGSFNADGVWRGSQGRLDLRQTFALDGATLRITMDLFNLSNQPITDVTVTRMLDVDDGEIDYSTGLPTLNAVTGINTVEAGLLGRSKGRKVVLTSDHPNARASVYGGYGVAPYDPFAPALLAGKVGKGVKGDKNINVTVPVGTIAPGETRTVVFEVGVG